MPVIDASAGDLTSPAALVRWITDELITNHNFTSRWGDVNASSVWNSGDSLRWLDRPAAQLFYGDTPLTIGLRQSDSSRGSDSTTIGIGMQIAKSLFDDFYPGGSIVPWGHSPGGGGASWYDDADVKLALPNSNELTACSNAYAGAPIGIDKLTTGNAPYIRARMITNPSSQSTTLTEPFYCYVIVEYSTGYFRKFGFGEVLKYYDWSGGIFAIGDIWGSTGNAYDSRHCNFASGCSYNQTYRYFQDEAYGFIYAPGWNGVADTDCSNGRGWMSLQLYNSGTSSNPGIGRWANIWSYMTGLAFYSQSPSSFSLQSERVPAVVFGSNQRSWYNDSTHEIHPMGAIPDIYQAVITDIDAYGVFQDPDSRKFMCVPHLTKLISEYSTNGSGRHGILISNPDLTVTIT